MVLFRERHSPEEEQKAWEFWHTRQHSFKQRVIDVGTLILTNTLSEDRSTEAAPVDRSQLHSFAAIWLVDFSHRNDYQNDSNKKLNILGVHFNFKIHLYQLYTILQNCYKFTEPN